MDIGVREVLYTDISRDGMLSGPDLASLDNLAAAGMNVIASGGISSEDDVKSLVALKNPNISGVIIGKALYENRVSLPALVSIVSRPGEK
jgi:phosphoribosylformimino-5-aminoimidazole carboxamide ribotide isomerase